MMSVILVAECQPFNLAHISHCCCSKASNHELYHQCEPMQTVYPSFELNLLPGQCFCCQLHVHPVLTLTFTY